MNSNNAATFNASFERQRLLLRLVILYSSQNDKFQGQSEVFLIPAPWFTDVSQDHYALTQWQTTQVMVHLYYGQNLHEPQTWA